MKYLLVDDYYAQRFTKDVNRLLRDGWRCHGPTQVLSNRHDNDHPWSYFQAMTKEDDEA